MSALLPLESRHTTGVIRDYRWEKVNIIGFYNDTRVILDKIDHNFSCEVHDFLCCDNNHLFDIDIYYNEIVLALTQAANFNIPKVPKNAMKHYWSITLDELKGYSLSRYRIWVAAGEPKQGISLMI